MAFAPSTPLRWVLAFAALPVALSSATPAHAAPQEGGAVRGTAWASAAVANANQERSVLLKAAQQAKAREAQAQEKVDAAVAARKKAGVARQQATARVVAQEKQVARLAKAQQGKKPQVQAASRAVKELNAFASSLPENPLLPMKTGLKPFVEVAKDGFQQEIHEANQLSKATRQAQGRLKALEAQEGAANKRYAALLRGTEAAKRQEQRLSQEAVRAAGRVKAPVTLGQASSLDLVVPTFSSVKAVDEYQATLKKLGVPLISSAQMKDPSSWPSSYLPLRESAGDAWQAGVAQARMADGRGLLVLPQETVAALKTGLSQVGVPYRWGGTTPAGFDCSGLMLYSLGGQGISLPRTAREQQGATIHVKEGNLLPGDMVFFGERAHHVAMYVGSGLMLEAPRTGLDVRVTKLRSITNASRSTL